MTKNLLDNKNPKRKEKSTEEEMALLLQQDQDLSRQLAAEEKLYAEEELALLRQQSQYLTDQLAVEEALTEATNLADVVVKVAGAEDALQNDLDTAGN